MTNEKILIPLLRIKKKKKKKLLFLPKLIASFKFLIRQVTDLDSRHCPWDCPLPKTDLYTAFMPKILLKLWQDSWPDCWRFYRLKLSTLVIAFYLFSVTSNFVSKKKKKKKGLQTKLKKEKKKKKRV